jgi:hypothetical protein
MRVELKHPDGYLSNIFKGRREALSADCKQNGAPGFSMADTFVEESARPSSAYAVELDGCVASDATHSPGVVRIR